MVNEIFQKIISIFIYIYISSRISLFVINHIIVVTARPNMTIELSFIMKFVS